LTILSLTQLKAQTSYDLKVKTTDQSQSILNKYKYQKKVSDLSQSDLLMNELIRQIHNDGYLLSRVESMDLNGETIDYQISIGPRFNWINISKGNVDPLLLRKVGYDQRQFEGRPVNFKELSKFENRILDYAENNGYPFASLSYDSLSIESNQISSSLNLDLGPKILFDSLRLEGSAVKRSFLESHIGVKPGALYEMSKIKASIPRIRALPYLRLIGEPEITYQNEEATVYYRLEKRRINTIDGFIGFLPNAALGSGLLITGQFDMDLYNPFLTGKHIGIHWRSPSKQSQVLEMAYAHPNLLKSPLSLAAEFEFLKQDTTYSKINFNVDFELSISAPGKIALFSEFITSNLLSTTQYQTATSLPEFADISNTLFGISFKNETWNDPIFPTMGYSFYLSAGLGNKIITRNMDLPEALYTGVDFESVQYRFDLNYRQYLSPRPRWNMQVNLEAGWIENDNLFRNDAYRLGGLNSIRGFDENFYFATRFVKSTFENRYLIDSSSYLFLFADFGYLQGFTASASAEAFLGFGTGLSFDTGRGIFNLVYALGTSNSVGPIDINKSKIHFGFTTRF
jgi:outer membrane protein assembly factor BamA